MSQVLIRGHSTVNKITGEHFRYHTKLDSLSHSGTEEEDFVFFVFFISEVASPEDIGDTFRCITDEICFW